MVHLLRNKLSFSNRYAISFHLYAFRAIFYICTHVDIIGVRTFTYCTYYVYCTLNINFICATISFSIPADNNNNWINFHCVRICFQHTAIDCRWICSEFGVRRYESWKCSHRFARVFKFSNSICITVILMLWFVWSFDLVYFSYRWRISRKFSAKMESNELKHTFCIQSITTVTPSSSILIRIF